MIASLRARAQQADALAAEVRALQGENQALRARLAELEAAPTSSRGAADASTPMSAPPVDFSPLGIFPEEESEDWMALIYALQGRAADATDLRIAILAGLKLGQVLQQQLGDPSAAIDAYRQVLELGPANQLALLELTKLLEQTERWMELTELLTQRIDLADAEPQRVSLLLRLANIYDEKLADSYAARTCYERVLAIDPSNPIALARR